MPMSKAEIESRMLNYTGSGMVPVGIVKCHVLMGMSVRPGRLKECLLAILCEPIQEHRLRVVADPGFETAAHMAAPGGQSQLEQLPELRWPAAVAHYHLRLALVDYWES
jgi:hypothetical protein